MADRRMFSKKIIENDVFMDMPLSAQCLYFHLAMKADDDGFVGSPKRIQQMIGASTDDLKLLIVKRYILAFDSGVVVIKHWKVHNTIQKDRYIETTYQEELKTLKLDDKKAYTEAFLPMETQCIQNVSKMFPQISIGKDRVDKDSIIDDYPPISPQEDEKHISIEEVVEDFNSTCKDLPKARQSYILLQQLTELLNKGYTQEDIHTVFQKASESTFLKKPFPKGGRATILWLTELEHFEKCLNNYYDDIDENETSTEEKSEWDFSQFDIDNVVKRKRGDNGEV